MRDRRDVTRREFIRVAGVAAGLFLSPGCGESLSLAPQGKDTALGDVTPVEVSDIPPAGAISSVLPSLGGAPDTAEGWAIAAFIDTVVPGAYRDPKEAPGGIDVGAPAMFFDPALPALPFVPLLAAALDAQAMDLYEDRLFIDCLPQEREQVVAELESTVEAIGFAIMLAKLAYFSSEAAAHHLGYPGPNTGYRSTPGFSFNEPLTTELTVDGNYV